MADDKKENTMIRINETELVALLGENGERWIKGEWGHDNSMCLHGAIRRCQPTPGDAWLVEKVAARQGWGPEWNDNADTLWADVRDRLAHVEVTDADLAATFGPQWQQIVALVRRAAALTADEAERLDAARAVGGAGVAPWAAAASAAMGAAMGAAFDAAWAAAWDAAWDAATDAAGALSVRHLIGHHGFTQDHYDSLVGPWVSVCGPVHPDDEEARRG